jgi:hypothetical protein
LDGRKGQKPSSSDRQGVGPVSSRVGRIGSGPNSIGEIQGIRSIIGSDSKVIAGCKHQIEIGSRFGKRPIWNGTIFEVFQLQTSSSGIRFRFFAGKESGKEVSHRIHPLSDHRKRVRSLGIHDHQLCSTQMRCQIL